MLRVDLLTARQWRQYGPPLEQPRGEGASPKYLAYTFLFLNVISSAVLWMGQIFLLVPLIGWEHQFDWHILCPCGGHNINSRRCAGCLRYSTVVIA